MDNRNLSDDQSDERGGQLELPTASASGSPFDALRQEDERGEFWSARDVMPHLDYEQWRRFVDSIDRAMAACRNSGDIVEDHFAASGKITINARGHKRVHDDYRLSRHGAFLVAMNGDPRKEAIANAQTYFARQTRKQELAEQATVPAPRRELSNRELALMVIEEADRADRAESRAVIAETKAAELEPRAQQADQHRAADGLKAVGDFANDIKAWAKRTCGVTVKHKQVWDFLAHLRLIIRGNTVRHNHPTAFATENDYVRPKETTFERGSGLEEVSVSPRLTPEGEGYAWDRITRFIAENGTLEIA